MRALVLAGGKGTRLIPLTPRLPKPFVPVANRPVLSWVLDHLDTIDLECIGVIVPTDQIDLYRRGLGSCTAAGTPIRWLAEREPLGSGGALRAQSEFFLDEPVLVVPADLICPVDLQALIAHHYRTERPGATVAVTACDLDTWNGDIAIPAGAGHGNRYLFKPPRPVSSDLGSTGTWLVEKSLVQTISPGFADFSSTVLPALPSCELRLGIFDTGPVYLRDVGTADGLLAANLEAITLDKNAGVPSRTLPLVDRDAVIETGAILEGPVLIGAGARVRRGARIHGPAVIGPGASVESNARVHRSLVLPGATIRAYENLLGGIAGDPTASLTALLVNPVQEAPA